ncbi:MAG: FAD-dependent urate hydroxylase [Hyphomicrobiaceae bacterium]|jgi:FAD-dependent urate hydroxylase
MKIGICGAGVGGLSAAIGLLSLGYEVDVFERAPDVRETGAGFNLWPNAGRAIYGLGLREQYNEIAVKLDRYIELDPEGKQLFSTDTSNWPEKYGAPAVGLYRPDLALMLGDAVGLERIKFNHDVVSVENAGDKAICNFSNGETYEADVIIGADGINSKVREQLIGGVTFRPNEHYAYRFRSVLDLNDVDMDPAAQTGFYAAGGWLSFIPIGKGKAYWFGSVSGANTFEDFIEFFSSWTKTPIPNTLSNTSRDLLVQSPLLDVDGVPYKWTQGRITLIGDAAHPMMPDMAQGASQTFVDALALRDAFANNQDVDQALRDYETNRRPVANAVVKCSQKGLFLGRNKVDPIAIRYQNEIEPVAA